MNRLFASARLAGVRLSTAATAATPGRLFMLYSEQFGSIGTKGGRMTIHGLFTTRRAAEDAIADVKKALNYDEEDPDYFFGVEPCDVDKVYGPGLVKERLSKASIAD
eukprot:EG_transcript_45528